MSLYEVRENAMVRVFMARFVLRAIRERESVRNHVVIEKIGKSIKIMLTQYDHCVSPIIWDMLRDFRPYKISRIRCNDPDECNRVFKDLSKKLGYDDTLKMCIDMLPISVFDESIEYEKPQEPIISTGVWLYPEIMPGTNIHDAMKYIAGKYEGIPHVQSTIQYWPVMLIVVCERVKMTWEDILKYVPIDFESKFYPSKAVVKFTQKEYYRGISPNEDHFMQHNCLNVGLFATSMIRGLVYNPNVPHDKILSKIGHWHYYLGKHHLNGGYQTVIESQKCDHFTARHALRYPLFVLANLDLLRHAIKDYRNMGEILPAKMYYLYYKRKNNVAPFPIDILILISDFLVTAVAP